MNRLFFFIAMLFVLLIQAQEDKNNEIIISGKIINAKDKVFSFKGLNSRIITKINFDDQGGFSEKVQINEQKFVLFEGINNAYIQLSLGDNIRLTADANDFLNSLKFYGKGADLNNYLIGAENLYLKENKSYKDKYSKSEEKFTQFMKEWKQKKLDFLNASHGLTPEFIEIEKRNIYYCYVRDFINYEKFHINYSNDNDFVVSETFLNEFKDFDWENEKDYRDIHFYSHLILDRVKNNFKKEFPSNKSDFVAYLKYINSSIKNQYIKDQVLYKNSEYNITYTNNLEEFYSVFNQGVKDSLLKAKIHKAYITLSNLSKGKPSPKFVDYENFNGGTNSLDDYLGKYVYIDIWATWCPPCINEISYLKELVEKYHGKNIEFISISVDTPSKYDEWKEKIIEKEMIWTQLYTDKDWSSSFIKNYSIKGIPRYILLDPTGKIINSNAPRPSDKKLIDLFKKLNI